MILRPYQESDGEIVAGWFRQERTMRLWSAGCYDHFPISGEDINAHYRTFRDNLGFKAYMAMSGDRPVGHFALLRREGGEIRILYVVVDREARGQGLGTRMMAQCVSKARERFGEGDVTLCVFAQNGIARRCYEKSGFRYLPQKKVLRLMEEDWECLEMAYAGEKE